MINALLAPIPEWPAPVEIGTVVAPPEIDPDGVARADVRLLNGATTKGRVGYGTVSADEVVLAILSETGPDRVVLLGFGPSVTASALLDELHRETP